MPTSEPIRQDMAPSMRVTAELEPNINKVVIFWVAVGVHNESGAGSTKLFTIIMVLAFLI